jgi:hypothetical protein
VDNNNSSLHYAQRPSYRCFSVQADDDDEKVLAASDEPGNDDSKLVRQSFEKDEETTCTTTPDTMAGERGSAVPSRTTGAAKCTMASALKDNRCRLR